MYINPLGMDPAKFHRQTNRMPFVPWTSTGLRHATYANCEKMGPDAPFRVPKLSFWSSGHQKKSSHMGRPETDLSKKHTRFTRPPKATSAFSLLRLGFLAQALDGVCVLFFFRMPLIWTSTHPQDTGEAFSPRVDVSLWARVGLSFACCCCTGFARSKSRHVVRGSHDLGTATADLGETASPMKECSLGI